MKKHIDKVLEYYRFKNRKIINYINNSNNLTECEIIQKGKELEELEYKMTALEIALTEV